jgi:hypothetical protein
MSAAMYLIAWLAFIIFGSSEEQEWAKVGREEAQEYKVVINTADN